MAVAVSCGGFDSHNQKYALLAQSVWLRPACSNRSVHRVR